MPNIPPGTPAENVTPAGSYTGTPRTLDTRWWALKRPPTTRSLPLMHQDGTLRYRNEDRVEILAAHLEQQFTPFPVTNTEHNDMVGNHLREYFSRAPAPDEDPIVLSPGSVSSAIQKLKTRKAPGADGIPNAALRHLPRPAVTALTRLYNGIQRTGHFPSSWKTSIVVMLPKPGPYGILQRMTPFWTPRPEQFGFRAEYGTSQQLARVLHQITAAKNKRQKPVAVFLDMEKAFDKVWHEGL
ncbi:jg24582, partial [Pararge aegeria aegeria]